MSEKKDFLDQFSNEGKPASFQEEERIPVQKQRKPLNVKALIIALIVLFLLLIGAYFLFFAPKIEMPDFVGRNKNDVAAWVKQQEIEATGIIFNETYDFDSEEGEILSQSIAPGKKVKNNVKIDFSLSLGPDPNEIIAVPDLDKMTKDEIQEWIAENKLLKTKTVTAYNDTIGEGEVIDYSFSGCEEDAFTRGCTLKINVSKGKAPAGKVAVEDFEKKIYETVESWAKSKKIELTKTEVYSDKIDAGYVISQSVAAGQTIDEGGVLNVVVSKGKAVYMVNMVGWNEKQLTAWQKKYPSVAIYSEEEYSDQAKGVVISQSLAPGKLIEQDDYVELHVSLGNCIDVPNGFQGSEYHANGGLHDWKDKENDKGANITVNRIREFSDTVGPEEIIRYDNSVCVGGTLNVVISRGRNILMEDQTIEVSEEETKTLKWSDLRDGKMDEDEARLLCEKLLVTYEVVYKNVDYKENGEVIRSYRSDNGGLMAGLYIPQDVTVYIEVCDKARG